MGYTVFGEGMTLEGARESCEYTVEALLAYPSDAVNAFAKPLNVLLEKADELQSELRRARRLVVRANARVRTWDGVGDDRIREFVKDLLAEVRQDRESPLFRAFFPMTPTEMVALTLAPEVEELARMGEVFGAKVVPEGLRKKWQKSIAEVVKQGRAALDERKRASQSAAESGESVARWIERADRLRRAIDGQVTTWAAEQGLSRDFNDRFFPDASRPRKKKDAAPAPPPPPA